LDPLTHALLGGSACLALSRVIPERLNQPKAPEIAVIGALSGLAPDLDIIIRSTSDPLLAWEYHRHFTHSLLFAPIGGLLVGAIYYLLRRRAVPFYSTVLFAITGMLLHGPLDALTSYGTLLYWPFSNERVALNYLSVIDPVYSLVLLTGLAVTLIRKNPYYNLIGLSLSILIIAIGSWQYSRASVVQAHIAEKRGHKIERGEVGPGLGSLLVWRSYYLSQGRLWSDAIRPGLKETLIWQGDSLPAFDVSAAISLLPEDSLLATDLARFDWFSDGYVAEISENELGDFRYGLLPQSATPLWGISFDPDREDLRVETISFYRQRPRAIGPFWRMQLGIEAGGRSLRLDEE